jgi:hypothetical protein
MQHPLPSARHHDDAAPACPAEIRALKAGMQARGVRYFLDLHADEERPFLWVLHPGAFILDKLPAHVGMYGAGAVYVVSMSLSLGQAG